MLNDDINQFLGTFSYPFVDLGCIFHNYFNSYYNETSKDKKEIREKLVSFIRKNYNYIYSYDEIYQYLDRWYLNFYNDKPKRNHRDIFNVIWTHLFKFSKCFISQRDGRIVYKYWENKNDKETLGGFSGSNKIYLFHNFNLLMPLDILTAIYMIHNNKRLEDFNGYYGHILVSDAMLDKVMQKGLAENHLHKGAAISFYGIWDGLMVEFNTKLFQKLRKIEHHHRFDMEDLYSLKHFIDCINDEKANHNTILYFLIFSASVIRICLLLISLGRLQHITCKKGEDFKKIQVFLSLFTGSFEERDVGLLLKHFQYRMGLKEFFMGLWDGLHMVFSEKSFQIKELMQCEHIETNDENIFLYQLVKTVSCGEDSEENRYRKILFLNYLRIKNYVYQILVQRKTVSGLHFFKEDYYKNNSGFSDIISSDKKEYWKKLLKENFQCPNLQKFELRMSINDNAAVFRKEIIDFLIAYRDVIHENYCRITEGKKYLPYKSFPKVGLVFHLLKEERNLGKRGLLDDWAQYKNLREKYNRQIRILKDLRMPKSLGNYKLCLDHYLLGIDVASLENAVPTWVFTNAFEEARDSELEPINEIDINGGGRSYQSLSFTFHAGEDFRNILTGVRRIHEVIKYLKFHAGDRIGHGIALGISVDTWYRMNSTVILPRIEALENYLWVHELFNEHDNDQTRVNSTYIQRRIYELSKELYGTENPPSMDILIDAYKALFDLDRNEEGEKECAGREERKREYEYVWTVRKVKEKQRDERFVNKMNEPVNMRITEQDIIIIKEAQRIVKEYVAAKGVIVETNPSSNVVIAPLETLKENQIYNINSCNYDFGNITVCVNSDDSSIFSTNVQNELGYIYFAMLDRGVSRDLALKWVDSLREAGMKASFIRNELSDEQVLEELETLLEHM